MLKVYFSKVILTVLCALLSMSLTVTQVLIRAKNLVIACVCAGCMCTVWGCRFYACYGVVNSTADGATAPVPPCFNGGAQCVSNGQCQDATSMYCRLHPRPHPPLYHAPTKGIPTNTNGRYLYFIVSTGRESIRLKSINPRLEPSIAWGCHQGQSRVH